MFSIVDDNVSLFKQIIICRTINLVLPHERYFPRFNDILVIKVSKPFVVSPTVSTIKMARFGFEPKGNITTY